MLAHRPHQQIRIDAVEEGLDVEINDPRVAPAALPRRSDRIERRFAGPVSIGVVVEPGLHQRLEEPFDHHLGDAVGNRGNPQRPRLAVTLRYVDPPHRRRKVAAGGHPIPELVEVVRKISLEVRNRLAVHPSRSLVGSDLFVGFPHLPFRNVERLCSIHGAPPVPGWLPSRAEQRNPFAPAPLQRLRRYSGLPRPCAPHRYSHPRRDRLLGFLPSHRSDRFPRSNA